MRILTKGQIGGFGTLQRRVPPSLAEAREGGRTRVEPAYAIGSGAYAAAALYIVADLLYLWTVPARFEQWWVYGAFFLAVAVAQGLYGVALLRYRGDTLYLAGIVVHLSVLALYAVTLAVNLPFLGTAWGVKPTSLLDTAATAAGLVAVLVLVTLLGSAWRGKVLNSLLAVGALASVLWLTGILS